MAGTTSSEFKTEDESTLELTREEIGKRTIGDTQGVNYKILEWTSRARRMPVQFEIL